MRRFVFLTRTLTKGRTRWRRAGLTPLSIFFGLLSGRHITLQRPQLQAVEPRLHLVRAPHRATAPNTRARKLTGAHFLPERWVADAGDCTDLVTVEQPHWRWAATAMHMLAVELVAATIGLLDSGAASALGFIADHG